MAFPGKKSHFIVLLPVLLTCFFLQLNKVRSSDSICFTYTRFADEVYDIILQGDATSPDGILLLTQLQPNGGFPAMYNAGRALFPSPIQLWESSTGRAASFSTSFSFNVDAPLIPPADGLTFFLAPADTDIPRDGSGGNLALYGTDAKPFVAAEFDTYQNDWDPPAPHIGVDINDVTSVITTDWNTTGLERGAVSFVRINYDAASTKLSVSLTYSSVPANGESTLTYDIALKDYLPEWVRVGFSASTGADVQFNRVLSWSSHQTWSISTVPARRSCEHECGSVLCSV